MTFLEFKDVSIVGRKTELYEVYSAHSKEFLGLIGWRNGWRRYVMSFKGGCDWSIECMAECYKFVTKLMQDRIGCGSVKEEDSVSRQLKKGDTQVVRGSTPFAASDAPSKAQEPIGCEKGRAEKVCRLPEKGNAEKRVVRLKSLPPLQVLKEHEENCDCCIATQGCELKSEVSPPVASRLNERSALTQEPKEENGGKNEL